MSETAPTSIESRLDSMHANVAAAEEAAKIAEQAKSDAAREKAWIGFKTEEKTSLTEKQSVAVTDMTNYLSARPATQEQADSLNEKWVDPKNMQNDTVENADGEYEPTQDSDKDLAYLEHEFSVISSEEDIAAALDLLSDYCEANGLSRTAEKTLRSHLLLNKTEDRTELPEVVEDAVVEPSSEPKASSLEDAAQVRKIDIAAFAQPASKEQEQSAAEFAVGESVSFLNPDGKISTGTIIEAKPDAQDAAKIAYVVKCIDDGKEYDAHAEDLSKVEVTGNTHEPETVDSEADAVSAETAAAAVESVNDESDDANDDTPDQSAGGDTTEADVTEEVSQYEKLKHAPTAAYIAITAMLREKKAKWNELPAEKKRKYGLIGAGAAIAVGIISFALLTKGHDTSSINNTVTDATTSPSPTPDVTPDASASASPSGPDVTSAIPEAAKVVQKGEGWFQTFKEMGVTSASDQKALLNEIGPKLVSMGEAYKDADLGGYGISEPGKLSNGALSLIQSVATARGYIS